jgi:prepilin-type N-terminal cleavage/methylation domain-containing protein
MAYSLVELMVVVSIMGTLSSIALTSVVKTMKVKAAVVQLHTIAHAITTARERDEKLTGELTGNYCSACSCWVGGFSSKSESCRSTMDTTLKRIGFPSAIKDPWGGYFMIDENEGEFAAAPQISDTVSVYNPDDKVIMYLWVKNYQYPDESKPTFGSWSP